MGFRDLTLYVIRHGQTEDNVAGRWTGRNDSPLTALGREHARASGRVLKRIAGDLSRYDFFASPLHRASTTMLLTRAAAGLPELGYRADRRLTENDDGDWTGLTVDEMRAIDPAHMARRDADEWHWKTPGGQSLAELSATVGRFLETLTRDSVIVCHGYTSRALRAQILGLPPAEAAARAMMPNTGVVRFADGKEEFFPE
ncbi:MAG TPA: histidine phosphatase family protein [Rhizomicrobium sp.]|jgi:probable phosphoglycerate mutase|nr:histidine phosphatase family protein [Rhizomicrobium sp.]